MIRKIEIVLLEFLLCFFSVACTDNSNDWNDNEGVLSFVIRTADAEYHAVIDNDKKEINMGGLQKASSIKSVEVTLSDGYSIEPDPTEIKEWNKTQDFILRKGNSVISYKCNLPDLINLVRDYVVFGYITAPGTQQFDNIFPTINMDNLTHVLISSGKVAKDGSVDFSSLNLDNTNAIFNAARTAGKKVLLSISKAANSEFGQAMDSPETRTKAVNGILTYVRERGYDGFDIDFEDYDYITNHNDNLMEFIKELHSKKEDLLMSCAVIYGGKKYGKEWAKYFDYINLMSYDAASNNTFEQFKAHIKELGEELGLGEDYSKMTGGVPFYGRDDSKPGNSPYDKTVSYAGVLRDYGSWPRGQREPPECSCKRCPWLPCWACTHPA